MHRIHDGNPRFWLERGTDSGTEQLYMAAIQWMHDSDAVLHWLGEKDGLR
jgi:hypothetical protein